MTFFVAARVSAIAALAETLLHSLWQCSLIAAALWFALRALPRARSSLRYGACCAALASMPSTSIATFVRLLAAEPPAREAFAAPTSDAPVDFSLLLCGAWALGCAAMLVRLGLGVTQLGRMLERAAPLEGAWQARLDRLARRLGLRRRVRLLASYAGDTPIVFGWLRPVILVPLGALTALPPAYVEALLLHELGHVRRLDYLVNLLQAGVEALLFHHPAVHWVSACLRAEREHCCDDLALAISGDRLGYARALAAMEEWRGASRQLALAANGGSLRERIERIVRAETRARRGRSGALFAAGVLCAALVVTSMGVGSWAAGDGAYALTALKTGADREELSISWLPPGVTRWKAALAEAAQRHDVSPELLAIFVLLESRGDSSAQSPRGAIGLMQIMPATAAAIAAERKLEGHSEARLWEPRYNLDFGAWYLARQLDAFGSVGDRALSLAAVAYNGGPGRARTYLERGNDAELHAEVRRYRDLVLGLWRERSLERSSTLAACCER